MTARSPRIAHVDVDAFFASVEQLLNPRLRGRPVLVGRGVVASASYEAKRCGVRTAMRLREALRLCPQAVVVPGQYEHYADYSARVQRILEDVAPVVEPAACDDFYLDFTGTERLYPDWAQVLRRLQRRIEDALGLTVSVGGATTKLVAAVASRLRRPRGFCVVPPGREAEFLEVLPVACLHGIGPAHAAALAERGVQTVGQLREIPLAALEALFGRVVGRQLWERARGLDARPVRQPQRAQSVSRETTIEGGTADRMFLTALLEYLAERVAATLRQRGQQARVLVLRLQYADRLAVARRVRLVPASNDEKLLLQRAVELLQGLYTRRVAIGKVGLTVEGLEPEQRQNELFDAVANRRWYLNRGVDAVRQRFGWNAVFYGGGLLLRRVYAQKPTGLILSTPCLSR
jgi:DNA polymerase-4